MVQLKQRMCTKHVHLYADGLHSSSTKAFQEYEFHNSRILYINITKKRFLSKVVLLEKENADFNKKEVQNYEKYAFIFKYT